MLVLGHGLHAVLFPVEVLGANGALGVAEAAKGGAVARKGRPRDKGSVARGRCARSEKGERKTVGEVPC